MPPTPTRKMTTAQRQVAIEPAPVGAGVCRWARVGHAIIIAVALPSGYATMPPCPRSRLRTICLPLRRNELADKEAPLAARMRPRTLDEFIGQDHIVGPGRLLRRAIQADQLSSVIFYGPPGTGKTTLARVIANTTRGHFIAINAVLAGVADIRAGDRGGPGTPRAVRPAHDPLRRRGPSLQQGPTRRAAAVGRERHRHPHRRHHREPLFRGQQGARQPQPHLPAQAADRGRPVRRSRGRRWPTRSAATASSTCNCRRTRSRTWSTWRTAMRGGC